MDWLKYENEALNKGYNSICGVDEAGRGPLAGPVCAAAVILPKGEIIEGVNDSKKLTEKKREALYDVIKEKAVAYSIAFATVEEIEEMNILNATMLAMKRAVVGLDVPADFAMIDGNKIPDLNIPAEYVIKGDANSMSIAAASILAKVTRDRLCADYDKEYPQYGFAKHKGYGTKLHREMILKYGPCKIHRMSFLKKLLNNG
ncbi:MAG: ribonuclease HII [Ruminococcus sp.]